MAAKIQGEWLFEKYKWHADFYFYKSGYTYTCRRLELSPIPIEFIFNLIFSFLIEKST